MVHARQDPGPGDARLADLVVHLLDARVVDGRDPLLRLDQLLVELRERELRGQHRVLDVEEPPVVITEQDIEQAFLHVLAGNYYQIPEQHLSAVRERLSPFMQYVENQVDTESSDDAAVNH